MRNQLDRHIEEFLPIFLKLLKLNLKSYKIVELLESYLRVLLPLAPISIAIKKDGSPRICLDLRNLNAVTKKYAKCIPNIDEQLARKENIFFS